MWKGNVGRNKEKTTHVIRDYGTSGIWGRCLYPEKGKKERPQIPKNLNDEKSINYNK